MDYHQRPKLSLLKLFERRLNQELTFELVLVYELFDVRYLSLLFQTNQSYVWVFQNDQKIQIHIRAPHFFLHRFCKLDALVEARFYSTIL